MNQVRATRELPEGARLARRLYEQAEHLERLTRGLKETVLSTRPPSGEWSLKELICHVWRVQQVFVQRLDLMLAQTDPALSSYDPDEDHESDRLLERSALDIRRSFLEDRLKLLGRLEQLTETEWRRTGRHPEYNHYDVRFLVEYLVYHEAHHIYQMIQRRAMLERPAVD